MKSRIQILRGFVVRFCSSLVVIFVTAMSTSLVSGQHCYVDSTQDCTLGGSTPCSSNSCIQFWFDINKNDWVQTPIPGAQTAVACASSAFYFTNATQIPYATITEEGDQGKVGIEVGSTVPCAYWATCHCRGQNVGQPCLFDQELGNGEELTESEATGDDCDPAI